MTCMKNDRIKNDRIKSDRMKNDRIKSDRIKTDRIKSITDPIILFRQKPFYRDQMIEGSLLKYAIKQVVALELWR
jgi:hypothetical protein